MDDSRWRYSPRKVEQLDLVVAVHDYKTSIALALNVDCLWLERALEQLPVHSNINEMCLRDVNPHKYCQYGFPYRLTGSPLSSFIYLLATLCLSLWRAKTHFRSLCYHHRTCRCRHNDHTVLSSIEFDMKVSSIIHSSYGRMV